MFILGIIVILLVQLSSEICCVLTCELKFSYRKMHLKIACLLDFGRTIRAQTRAWHWVTSQRSVNSLLRCRQLQGSKNGGLFPGCGQRHTVPGSSHLGTNQHLPVACQRSELRAELTKNYENIFFSLHAATLLTDLLSACMIFGWWF